MAVRRPLWWPESLLQVLSEENNPTATTLGGFIGQVDGRDYTNLLSAIRFDKRSKLLTWRATLLAAWIVEISSATRTEK